MSAGLSRSAGRNLGVDALRCIAMLLIVSLHVMNRGGALPGGGGFAALWIYPLRILASAAVDVYALISGYVTVRGRFRPARVFELWFQVWVLNVVIGLTGSLISPDAMDGSFWVRYLFPFTQKAYWYFTAYVGVYALSPVVNRGICALTRRQSVAVLWITALVFCLGSFFGYLNQGDPFGIVGGYSVLWLLALYIIGACVRQSDFLARTKTRRLVVTLALVLILGTFLFWLLRQDFLFKRARALNSQLLSYTGPLLLTVSLLLLLIFARLRVGPRAAKLIGFLSPLTFGVYIIHVHHVIWIPLVGTCKPLLKLPAVLLPFAVVFAALGLFAACLAVEWLRSQLFRLLRVRQLADRLETALRRWMNRIVKE